MSAPQRHRRPAGRRTPLRARALLAAAPLLLSIGIALPVSAPAPAFAAGSRCAPGTGVTVVVDFGALGGGTQLGCDPSGAGKSAVSVMNAAGIDWEYTQGQPFVCRIESKPSTSQESCQGTPPEDAYWGLFWSDGTRDWTYATQGASSQSAPEGGSIGWRFQSSSTRTKPGAAPTRPAPEPQPSPKPKPSPKPTTQPSPTSSSPSSSPSGSAAAEATPEGATSDEAAATAKQAKAEARADAQGAQGGKDGKDGKGKDGKDAKDDRDRKRAQDARDREESTEEPSVTDEDDQAVAGGDFVAPVSAESGGLSGSDVALLAVGGLCAAGLAASAVVMARRRRL